MIPWHASDAEEPLSIPASMPTNTTNGTSFDDTSRSAYPTLAGAPLHPHEETFFPSGFKLLFPRQILHVDFNAVNEANEIHARVPVELTGDAVGIKNGGILDTLLHDIEVHCLPKDLPSVLSFDVSDLGIGDSLSIGSAPFPDGVSASLDDSVLIAIVNETRAALSETSDDGATDGGSDAAEAESQGEAAGGDGDSEG